MVETLIPKTEPGYVMVVNGELKGQVSHVYRVSVYLYAVWSDHSLPIEAYYDV